MTTIVIKNYLKVLTQYKDLNIIYKKHSNNIGQSQNFKLLQRCKNGLGLYHF